MSVNRKNLRATKGKKRWRKNIDITDLEKEINENQEFKLDGNKKKELLSFTIDN